MFFIDLIINFMRKLFLRFGGLMALFVVVLGVFGLYGLKNVVDVVSVNIFEIGVWY